jgi:hypothetical protein
MAEQYDAGIAIPAGTAGEAPLFFPTVPVISSELHSHGGFHALIGRDILASCVLVYNGSHGHYTLCF